MLDKKKRMDKDYLIWLLDNDIIGINEWGYIIDRQKNDKDLYIKPEVRNSWIRSLRNKKIEELGL
jgi:hypothetical protein